MYSYHVCNNSFAESHLFQEFCHQFSVYAITVLVCFVMKNFQLISWPVVLVTILWYVIWTNWFFLFVFRPSLNLNMLIRFRRLSRYVNRKFIVHKVGLSTVGNTYYTAPWVSCAEMSFAWPVLVSVFSGQCSGNSWQEKWDGQPSTHLWTAW